MKTITLPPELEAALTKEAERAGITPEILALETLRERFGSLEKNGNVEVGNGAQAETMLDFHKDFIGVISSAKDIPGGARMSENCGKQFADGMREKQRQGKL